jgi:hypothetical protein
MKKGAVENPQRPFCFKLQMKRQERFEILAIVLPCGQGRFPVVGRPERVLNEFFPNGPCSASFGFAWQRNTESGKYTSFREHFSHNENRVNRMAHAREETLIPRVIALERNDLGGLL